MPAPDGFHWRLARDSGNWWLDRQSDGTPVACVSERVTGGWVVWVNRHLWRNGSFFAPSLGRSRAWAEAWCRVHAARLLVEPKEPWGGWEAQRSKMTRVEKAAWRKSRG